MLDYGFNVMSTKIFIDNQSTIYIVKNPFIHQRTNHIEIRHHFIRDANEKNLIQDDYCVLWVFALCCSNCRQASTAGSTSVPAGGRTSNLRMLFHSLADEDAHAFWRNQDNWRIHSCHLYPRTQVHVLETVDGRDIYMFIDVSYPLSAATLKRMLKHGLEVPKLLVGGDLTMAEQLVSFIKDAILNAQSTV
nr:putative ribonuclease H-like domain-containing protein [Tanacetum cinerariifolium]